MGRWSVLQARSLSVEIGGRLTLADATFSLRAGDKVGLVGRNGTGKTSLLSVLAGHTQVARELQELLVAFLREAGLRDEHLPSFAMVPPAMQP